MASKNKTSKNIDTISKYDLFFSRSMEHIGIATSIIKVYLDEPLRKRTIYESLHRQDRKHTDGKLKQRQSDIIYEASMGDYGSVSICIEHRSQPQRNLPTKTAYYGLDTLEGCTRRRLPWPVIALIILYHGKESPYPYPLHPEECYACPELAMPYFSFKLNVVDLNTLSDETILKGGICAPLLLLLKHGRDGIFELEPQAYRAAFKACIESVGEDYIETMLDYAQSLSSREAGKRVFHFIAEVLNDKKDKIMTYGQQLRQEGMQQGIRQGMQDRTLEIARNMISQLHLGMDIVQQTTGLSREALKKLANGV